MLLMPRFHFGLRGEIGINFKVLSGMLLQNLTFFCPIS